MKKIIKLILSLLSIAFIINIIWEAIHAKLFYALPQFSFQEFLQLIAYASLMDALLIILMYFTTALIVKDNFWLKKLNAKSSTIFIILGILIAAWIEYRAIYLKHLWQYNALMPTLFGLGISPLIQLAITGMLTIIFVKRILQ